MICLVKAIQSDNVQYYWNGITWVDQVELACQFANMPIVQSARSSSSVMVRTPGQRRTLPRSRNQTWQYLVGRPHGSFSASHANKRPPLGALDAGRGAAGKKAKKAPGGRPKKGP